MSDDEDAHSEAAPDGWTSMFNRVSPIKDRSTGKPPRKHSRRPSASAEVDSGAAGWLGGWFGASQPKSRMSSISSDTPPKGSSQADSEEDADDGRKKWEQQEDPEEEGGSAEGSLHAYEVDSDGFPVTTEDRKSIESAGVSNEESETNSVDEDILKAYNDGSLKEDIESPVTKAAKPMESSPRKERMRNRMNFTLTHTAADTAERADPIFAGDPDIQQAVADSQPIAEPAGWWGALFPVAAPAVIVPTNIVREEEKPKTTSDVPIAQIPAEGGGMWGNMFGSSPAPPVEPIAEAENVDEPPQPRPRDLLPPLRPPPSIDALNEVNSYFNPVPYSQSIEMFGARPLSTFQGKLRGWPRRLAPHWSSSQGASVAPARFSQPAGLNGVSALAMFRVT